MEGEAKVEGEEGEKSKGETGYLQNAPRTRYLIFAQWIGSLQHAITLGEVIGIRGVLHRLARFPPPSLWLAGSVFLLYPRRTGTVGV